MKKFLIIFAAAAMLLVPALAEAGGRHGHHRGGNDWVAPMIFGTVLGVIISNNHGHGHVTHRRHHRRYARHCNPGFPCVDRPRPHVKVCERVGHMEWDRRGHRYVVNNTECRMVPTRRW